MVIILIMSVEQGGKRDTKSRHMAEINVEGSNVTKEQASGFIL
jgi:hypothetical protein